MSSKTKIVVLRMKEIIYTAIFIGLGLLLIALLLIMFRPGRKTQSASAPAAAGISYLPGMYSSTLTLGSQAVNVEVTVDSTQITSVTFKRFHRNYVPTALLFRFASLGADREHAIA